jgi:hypothetical protein
LHDSFEVLVLPVLQEEELLIVLFGNQVLEDFLVSWIVVTGPVEDPVHVLDLLQLLFFFRKF